MDLSYAQEKLKLVFSGYNNSSILVFPPKKINKSYYRCDNHFHLDTILDMYNESSSNYGIVLISGKEYRCYILNICNTYKEFKLVNYDTANLPNNHNKGGSSSGRGIERKYMINILTK